MININALKDIYFASDEPVPYRLKYNNTEIKIRPIKVRNWAEFSSCLDCICFNREDLNNVDYITMPYLEFLFHMHMEKSEFVNLHMLSTIIKHSLGENLISMDVYNDKFCLAILDENTKQEIDGEIKANVKYYITPKEFDDIKKIILFQNIYDYDDRYISPDVRKSVEETQRIKNRNMTNPSMEKRKILVMSINGMSMAELNDMSYRVFCQIYHSLIERDMYFVQNMMKASPNYEVKDEVIYPTYRVETNILDASFVEKDTLEKKIR